MGSLYRLLSVPTPKIECATFDLMLSLLKVSTKSKGAKTFIKNALGLQPAAANDYCLIEAARTNIVSHILLSVLGYVL